MCSHSATTWVVALGGLRGSPGAEASGCCGVQRRQRWQRWGRHLPLSISLPFLAVGALPMMTRGNPRFLAALQPSQAGLISTVFPKSSCQLPSVNRGCFFPPVIGCRLLMQCRDAAGSDTSLTYSTVIHDRVQRRGETHGDLSSGCVEAHGFTEPCGDLGAGRSFPVPPCSPSEQGPAAIHLSPNPQKTAMSTAGVERFH